MDASERDDDGLGGVVVETEPCFELSPEAMAYLASSPASFAPDPVHG